MPEDFEHYGRSVDDIEFHSSSFYDDLPHYDAESIRQIKTFLKEKKYTDKKTINDHISCLENIEKRLALFVSNMQEEGRYDQDLDHDVKMVRNLVSELIRIKQSIA